MAQRRSSIKSARITFIRIDNFDFMILYNDIMTKILKFKDYLNEGIITGI